MTIREIEALSGMTRANIRFYESEGLLTPNRMENGYRDYTRSDLDTLHKIRLLRALGLGIDEIRKLSAGETALGEALESRLSAMQEEQRTLVRAEEVARAMLRAHADYATLDTGRYLAALEAGAQTAVQQDVQPKLHAPWRRFFARMIDLLLYDLTWMVILTSAGLCAAGNRGVTLLNDFLALLTMLLLEPLLLQKPAQRLASGCSACQSGISAAQSCATPRGWTGRRGSSGAALARGSPFTAGCACIRAAARKRRKNHLTGKGSLSRWQSRLAGSADLPRSWRRQSCLPRASAAPSRPSARAIAARSPSNSSQPTLTAAHPSSARRMQEN